MKSKKEVPFTLAWLATAFLAAWLGAPSFDAGFTPAPQAFRQEVAGYFDIRAGLANNTLAALRTNISGGNIQLTDLLPDGSVWFYAADHWFIHRPAASAWVMGG